MSATPESILKDVFGYDSFRPLQREVIAHVLEKRDTLAIMPTGGGKSLCYQIPALIFPGITVVVSPLIALMKDQVEQMVELGIPALFINSSLSLDEYQENMRRVRSGKIKLLYVAPETLLTPRILGLLGNIPVSCFTIDEAHCISEWGHDFRPEYRQLVEVRKRFPQAVCLAMTATATQRVREDIKKTLGYAKSSEFIASFNRSNLMLEVIPKADPEQQTLRFLRQFKDQSGIIYCFSRKQVDDLSATLVRHGFSARPYHAGLEDDERRRNQELFIDDDVQIIVATIAFGMGINKPNVRFVIHYDLPKSIENYYQEIGRAGRDGLPAHCLLLYSYGDVQKQRYFIDQKPLAEQKIARDHLEALIQYAESIECRRVPLLAHFDEVYGEKTCKMCDNCLKSPPKQVDITTAAQKFLSCVARTGERFGAVHIVDVLLGSRNQKVLKFSHEDLSTFGIGKELDREQWLNISRQLQQQGLLVQDTQYKGLKLTVKAQEMLRGKSKVTGTLAPVKVIEPEIRIPDAPEYNHALFYILRQKRKELADQAHVPPYVIFSDKTLIEMATYYPMTAAGFRTINGVGEVKIAHYGDIFMPLIRDFCQQHHLKEALKPGAGKNRR
jgi:ATP-dependent DNA helicase RecQ